MPDYTSLGISFPVPTDEIKRAQLEAKLADDIKQTAVTATQAILVEGSRAESAAKAAADGRLLKLEPRDMPASANLDSYRTAALQGPYRIPNATVLDSLTGTKPPVSSPGHLTVEALTSGAAWQTYRTWYGSDAVYWRSYSPLNYQGYNGWSKWSRVETNNPPDILGGENLDSYRGLQHQGRYRIPDNNRFNALAGTLPPQVSPGFLTVEVLSSGAAWQTFKAWYGGAKTYTRTYSPLAPVGWTAWEALPAASEVEAVAATAPAREAHHMRREMMIRRKGGAIGTNGKGAMCLRIDHGFASVRDKLLPLFRKYGIPVSVAVNSATLNTGESAGVGYTQLAAWGREYGFEYANHALDHNDATTPAAMKATIAGNLDQMRTGLPDHAIDVFMMPGVSGTKYNGFNAGTDLQSYFDHPAGRIMLEHHGLVTGETTGKNVPLTGTPFNGIGWHTLDVNSWVAVAKTQIGYCASRGLGCTVMLHPALLDTESRTTTAQIESFLSWLAAERDGGRVVLLTQSGLAVADAGRSTRLTLNDPASGVLPQTVAVPVTGQEWLRGGTLEAAVTVTGTAGDQVKVTFGGVETTATLTAATQTIYRHTVCPLTGTGDMAVTVEAAAGTPTLTSVDVRPV